MWDWEGIVLPDAIGSDKEERVSDINTARVRVFVTRGVIISNQQHKVLYFLRRGYCYYLPAYIERDARGGLIH